MNNAKFWLVQMIMLAFLSLAFGSPAIAAPKSKAITNSTTSSTDDLATHGEEMRLDNANLEEGKADWKTGNTPDPDPDPVPVCDADNRQNCTEETCEPAGGFWGSDNICYFFG